MRTNPDYRHIGETYNHRSSDRRQTNLWVFISIAGMVLMVTAFWIFCVIYDHFKL